ncbi:UrcA family protein [Novosphingobium album (ex Hu et al. 2023)]|uniref:UrcA family protein n=1 Tax=Novosphingobium album (ex Hu et al. 2023) TaxID=2930093 RepID=A0ABT0B1G5_9SPHN|nr:UrcA family protein [Novosphingobium album (ex Hu et al. 2023)]MCJ2178931.1 UrcA family protein [Novosphingobium album (ex Hu et al. 2023)]
MKNLLKTSLAVAALGLALTAPAVAQDRIGDNRYAVTLDAVDTHPATPEAAKRTLVRIENAALVVCGASSSSLREVKSAVRRSVCWHDAMADALTRIGDPQLALAYNNKH